ncbi:lipocalin family protein [Jejudonia soesokkakensis]|uniref:Lipocalin family protein n=1 Tax=Jejudonia soesokkakensis TaxID=1323432 RepID=A0ABW2MSD8_9FLAO
MKTILNISLILSVFILFSCNKDDSKDENNNIELIVGEWQLDKRFFLGKDGSVTEVELDPCDQFTTLTFNDDFTYFYTLRTGTNCEANNDRSGVYEFIEENRIILEGNTFAIYTIRGTVLDANYQESFFSEEFIKL